MLTGYLRQSTAVTVPVGPFVDSTDGDAEETGLTIAQADVRLSKNGGTNAQKNNASSATHEADGVYLCPLSTTDTNTLGILTLWVHVAGALFVRHDYMIVPSNIWDSWFGSDLQQVDAREFAGVTAVSGAIPAVAAGANGGLPLGNAAGAVTLASATHTGAVIPTVTTLTNAPSDSSGVTTLLSRLSSARAGYLDNLSAGAVALASNLSTLAGKFTGITLLAEWLGLIAGKQTGNSTARTELRATGAGSGTYDETTDSLQAIRDAGASPGDIADAVWDEDITGHSATDSAGEVLQAAAAGGGGGGGGPTAGQIADAVWDEALSGHTTSGTAGERLGRVPNAAAGGSGGLPTVDASNRIAGIQGTLNTLDQLDTAQDAQHATTQGYIDTEISSIISSLSTIAGYLDTEVAAIKAKTDNLPSDPADASDIAAAIAALNNISASDVLTQVNSALNASISELSAVPGATPSLRNAVMFLFMALRNRSTTTASAQTVQNDAGSTIATAAVSDDGSVFTKGEFA